MEDFTSLISDEELRLLVRAHISVSVLLLWLTLTVLLELRSQNMELDAITGNIALGGSPGAIFSPYTVHGGLGDVSGYQSVSVGVPSPAVHEAIADNPKVRGCTGTPVLAPRLSGAAPRRWRASRARWTSCDCS